MLIYQLKHLSLWQIISLIIFGVLLILIAFNFSAIKQWLSSYHLLPEPEKLTELYFEDHTSLPTHIDPVSPQSFSFTIHNLEYTYMVYPYLITADNGTDSKELYRGSAVMNHDQSQTINVSYQLATASARTKISVILPNQHQSIDYWLEP